jgi:hypothetical protein
LRARSAGGFVEGIDLSATEFLANAKALFAPPTVTVRLTDKRQGYSAELIEFVHGYTKHEPGWRRNAYELPWELLVILDDAGPAVAKEDANTYLSRSLVTTAAGSTTFPLPSKLPESTALASDVPLKSTRMRKPRAKKAETSGDLFAPGRGLTMTLDEIDRRVLEANGRPVPLDAFPTVYDAGDRYTLEPLGPVAPEADEELALFLLSTRYPGVEFEPADVFPGFHLADPEPDVIVGR